MKPLFLFFFLVTGIFSFAQKTDIKKESRVYTYLFVDSVTNQPLDSVHIRIGYIKRGIFSHGRLLHHEDSLVVNKSYTFTYGKTWHNVFDAWRPGYSVYTSAANASDPPSKTMVFKLKPKKQGVKLVPHK